MQVRVTVFTSAVSKDEADVLAAAVLKAARAESTGYPTVRLETREKVSPTYEYDTENEDLSFDGADLDVEDEFATDKSFSQKLGEKLGF